VAVYFPTNRNVLDIPDRIRPHDTSALDAYDGALDTGERNFRTFFEWFRDEEDLWNQQVVENGRAPDTSPLPAVRRAILKLLPGASHIRVERRPQRMTVDIRGRQLNVAQLSDGEKCVLALVGDLARRMVLANPGSVEPLQEQAVVLIDEVELHLHPGLQRIVLHELGSIFPNVQFIVTTHSPQVLSAVRAEQVKLLKDFRLEVLDRETWQRDTNRILEAVFNDTGRPPEVSEMLNRLRTAVDEDRVHEARQLIKELRGMLEGDDPDVFFYEQLLPPEDADA